MTYLREHQISRSEFKAVSPHCWTPMLSEQRDEYGDVAPDPLVQQVALAMLEAEPIPDVKYQVQLCAEALLGNVGIAMTIQVRWDSLK
jgi:hypothetical protein